MIVVRWFGKWGLFPWLAGGDWISIVLLFCAQNKSAMEAQIQHLQGFGSGLGVCINRVILRCKVRPLGHRAGYMTLALPFLSMDGASVCENINFE